jgi:TRAP-type C4-dicarboxylate transport system permease small subunit
VLRARAPTALAEVERLQAQSKFFRSLTTALFLMGTLFVLAYAWSGKRPTPSVLHSDDLSQWTVNAILFVAWVLLLITSVGLYFRTRNKAVKDSYELAVVSFSLGGKAESSPAARGNA